MISMFESLGNILVEVSFSMANNMARAQGFLMSNIVCGALRTAISWAVSQGFSNSLISSGECCIA